MTQAVRDAILAEHNQLRRTLVRASDMIEVTGLFGLFLCSLVSLSYRPIARMQ